MHCCCNLSKPNLISLAGQIIRQSGCMDGVLLNLLSVRHLSICSHLAMSLEIGCHGDLVACVVSYFNGFYCDNVSIFIHGDFD